VGLDVTELTVAALKKIEALVIRRAATDLCRHRPLVLMN
jgi:hypothetical protein